ncbi:MAG TPA: DUF58 domain-containing protein, partial [Armatimonadota bacterium]|nr:DUF58 domain-containing protein [Armatimonadota bacterium]
MRLGLIGEVDAPTLARLANMELRARAVVEGHYSGQHRSPYHGASIEFADHRAYSHGDELRHLDWKLYGRGDRFFVKQYDAETNLNVHLLLDCSGSMDYPDRGPTKLSCGSYLAAALAYLAHLQRDASSLTCFDTRITRRLPPSTQRGHLQRVFEALDAIEAGGETDLPGVLEQVSATTARRGLLVLISDLLGPAEAVLRALAHFRHRGHDTIVFHVLDPSELDFSFRGPLLMEDLESGRRLGVEAGEIRSQYRQAMRAHLSELAEGCRISRTDYELFVTDRPFGPALMAYLGRRNRSIA